MISNKEIQRWLDEGLTVRSAAMGRVGRVLAIGQFGDVHIKSVKPRLGVCSTSFESGDSCHAKKINGEIVICNDGY